MPIRVLPPELVNQIAAGEVVERPASVVKELVENAIDAGARRVVIEVEGGGVELVRVSDDGLGIAPDELPLAIAAHATSKVATSDDLAAIATFGFRGEALASIASVSRFRLASCRRGADAGSEIEVEGGAIRPVRPAPARPGTVVEVRTLFFNVPARRKFLRAEGAETARVTETVEAIALSHPHVAFELRSNGRRLVELPATDEPAKRTLDVLGKELEPELLEFEERFPELGGLVVRGYAGKPAIARPNARAIRIHLNGRPIMDRVVLHAVREAYRGLLDSARTPTVALLLEVDPREVDVNVHPAKSEVRFRAQQAIHGAVRKTIERALRAANLVPHFVPDAFRAGGATGSSASSGGFQPDPSATRALFGSGLSSIGGGGGAAARGGWVEPRESRPATDFSAFAALASEFERAGTDAGSPDTSHIPVHVHAHIPAPHTDEFAFIQLLGGFVVTEDADGIVIVDQHALHERAMFATLLSRISEGPLESQRLLVPVPVECSAREVELLDEIAPLLVRLGVSARAFGPRAVAVEAVPTLLHSRGVDAGGFLRDILAKALEHGSLLSLEAALHEVVDMMACKAAVKAGDSLTRDEIRALLRMRVDVERAAACPHGRPTSIRIARGELERRFGRS